MSGFEFLPTGEVAPIVPRDDQGMPIVEAEAIPASTFVSKLRATQDVSQPRATIKSAPAVKAASANNKSLTSLCRARLKDVEREIKRLKKLELERDELKRMLAAASQKTIY